MSVKKHQVNLRLCENIPVGWMNVDRPKVHQALLNLFVNAADAVSERGTVEFSCAVEKTDVWFEVADDGPGVPGDLTDQIFQPFFTTKPAGQGSGMGLAVSRRIAEVHGGSLRLMQSDNGARFILTLPLNWEQINGTEEKLPDPSCRG